VVSDFAALGSGDVELPHRHHAFVGPILLIDQSVHQLDFSVCASLPFLSVLYLVLVVFYHLFLYAHVPLFRVPSSLYVHVLSHGLLPRAALL